MSSGPRIAIWNPASGGAAEEGALRSALGDDVELLETTPDDPGTSHAARAVAEGAEIVVACGGDGTVRACLEPLAGTATALAVVPLGTGNLLAANLDIPTGLDACERIGRGSRRTIDLGRINGEAFAVMAGTGFDALMIRDADPTLKARVGSIAYVLSALRNLRADLVPTTIHVDDELWLSARTSMVLVGNFGTITGGIDVFPDALPDDGILEIAVVAATTWREWARVGWHLLTNRPVPRQLVRRTRGRRVTIEHERPRVYELDGEDRDPVRHLDIGIEPGSLTVHQAARSGRGSDTTGARSAHRRLAPATVGYDEAQLTPDRVRRASDTHPPTKGHTMSTDATVIEDLVQTLEDGREGYARAAEKLDGQENGAYVTLFRELSQQRERFSAELRNLRPGEQTEADGTLAGNLHRGWMALKDALTGSSTEAILNAVTTGENHAVEEYDTALESDLSASLRAVVERQRSEVVEARDRVSSLSEIVA